MKTVFISRSLSPNSTFLALLKSPTYEVHGESLLHFEAVNFDTVPPTDWIFFYSKNAIRFFFDALKSTDKSISVTTQYAAIGEGTAAVLKTYGLIADFVGTGQPKDTAIAFKKVAKGQKVLFPRAFNSRQSIQQLLANHLLVKDLIVYKNTPKKTINITKTFDCLVFTSSLNARIYFQNYNLKTHQIVIAIGPTTAQTLKNLGVNRVIVAKETTETALAIAVLKHF